METRSAITPGKRQLTRTQMTTARKTLSSVPRRILWHSTMAANVVIHKLEIFTGQAQLAMESQQPVKALPVSHLRQIVKIILTF